MKLFVGVTDNDWFGFLARRRPAEVNFWRPGGASNFRAIEPGDPFLFKLHSPLNYIAGGAFFVRHSLLPLIMAWDCFGQNNGAATLSEVQRLIRRCRRDDNPNPTIGCTILTEPFFLPREEWIPVPAGWSSNIVTGKTYSTDEATGGALWEGVRQRLASFAPEVSPELSRETEVRYGREFLSRARLGQGAFRVLVTEAYERRCSITGERTLPVLEAAHIKPFAEEGPNRISNGLLLRSDLHILFDKGYVTLTKDSRVLVSRRIREEYENGRDYYALDGRELKVVPDRPADRPAPGFIEWHNEHVFAG